MYYIVVNTRCLYRLICIEFTKTQLKNQLKLRDTSKYRTANNKNGSQIVLNQNNFRNRKITEFQNYYYTDRKEDARSSD